ncbi:MAG: hypothetical protein JSS59_02565 [Proteobacteria bacterium]|uniref:hypothetical protein n=1 Tax=Rudaea sp. TaxID=2136325 RepID=UPI0037847099|nr:hypothetical protein [Pseudomonadota bacterium]
MAGRRDSDPRRLARSWRNAQHRFLQTDIRGESMKRHLWIVAVIIAALAAGWWLGRGAAPARSATTAEKANADAGNPDATARSNAPKRTTAHAQSSAPTKTPSVSKPLPPPGTPLKQTFDELKARADAGDAQAASRLYRDLNICFAADAVIRSNALEAEDILRTQNSADPVEVQQAQLDNAQRFIKGSGTLKILCAGVDPHILGTLPAASLQAAQLGDANARDCYVHRGPFVNPGSLVSDPSSIDTYRAQAPALIDSAMAAGDWKMVSMLQYAYGPSGTNMIAGLVGPDPIQHYRYLKLFRLGADGYRVPQLDKELAYAAKQLDAQQLIDADAWAQTTQQAYFKGSSTDAAPQNWNACAVPSE